jgi:hypothetical protein|tara:strand:+ start:972 stop:1508 length:537 start_codon:yes stop_codon:yes gene_type:complete
VYNIFSTPIFIDDIDLSKVNLLSESFKAQWESNTTSSHGETNTLKQEEVKYLLDTIVKNLNEFIQDPFEISLTQMWRNKYKPGDFQEKHAHVKHSFSFIIYEQVTESKTVFVHPIQQLLLEKYGYDKDDKMECIFNHQHEPKCKAGQIIIFPSYLEHFVRSNDEETITVAGNIKLNIK